MPINELFSERQRRLREEIPDVFVFDDIPYNLRVQVIHIMEDAIGYDRVSEENTDAPYKHARDILCREYGRFQLDSNTRTRKIELQQFFLKTQSSERALDVIEILVDTINRVYRSANPVTEYRTVKLSPDEAINELNERFKRAGVGYTFENGRILRLDSTYAHTEVTRPAIKLLWSKTFSGANEEYMTAHEHYRHGRNQECIVNCLKAFESTMKIICEKKEWDISRKSTAGQLIDVFIKNDIVPDYLQHQTRALQDILKSGVPTIRNNAGGHGQGPEKRDVTDKLAKYCLNLTGANIIYLIDQSGVK
jgi:hypothetical protein